MAVEMYGFAILSNHCSYLVIASIRMFIKKYIEIRIGY